MREKNLAERIKKEVQSKKVTEPFKSWDYTFLEKSPSFISKHSLGNGRYNEYFVRVARGLYKLK